MSEDRFTKLKEKYVSVLSYINREDLSVQNIHLENDKLLIRAKAPSEKAKNGFWDAVKKVDADYTKDFAGDISVAPVAAKAAETKPATGSQVSPGVVPVSGTAAAPKGTARTYTVAPGDTLSKIAKQFYGNANDYPRIFEANRDQLKDPDKIKPGQVLKIPELA